MQFMRMVALFCILTFLPSCFRQPIRIKANAIADKEIIPYGISCKNSLFICGTSLVNGVETKNELEIKELKRKLSYMLEKRGYRIVNSCEAASYCLMFNYGMTSETQTFNVLKYIPGQKVVASGTIYGKYGGGYEEQIESLGSWTYMPEQHTFYTKFIVLNVHDSKRSLNLLKRSGMQSSSMIWNGNVYQIDECGDFRKYLDPLVVTLCNLFGRDTHGIIDIAVNEDDDADIFVLRSADLMNALI